MGFLSSFSNHMKDHVRPSRGCIVKVALFGGVQHTGVYVGNDRIVEVTTINGTGIIRKISSKHFLNGDDDSLNRVGISIYIACDKDKNVLADSQIANQAEYRVGDYWDYELVGNNCHTFTNACVTGDFSKLSAFNMLMLETNMAMHFLDSINPNRIDWRVGDF